MSLWARPDAWLERVLRLAFSQAPLQWYEWALRATGDPGLGVAEDRQRLNCQRAQPMRRRRLWES